MATARPERQSLSLLARALVPLARASASACVPVMFAPPAPSMMVGRMDVVVDVLKELNAVDVLWLSV